MMLKLSDDNLKNIDSVKNFFLTKKNKIKEQFYYNHRGIKCCKLNSDLTDVLIKKIFELTNPVKLANQDFLICAVGGYGRKHLAPYSDIDLLFVYNQKIPEKELKRTIEQILYPLWDLGMKVGHAVRTFKEVISLSKKEQIIKTSILDARLILGCNEVFKNIITQYTKEFSKKAGIFLKEKVDERKKNIQKIGFDYFKNEPNLKESEGSLRDINLIHWCLKILKISQKKNVNNFADYLNLNEKKKISKSLDFLLTLRCFSHYISQRQNDKLTFDLQKTIADKIKTTEKIHKQSATELLMKDYFKQIKQIKTLAQVLSESVNNQIRNKKVKGATTLKKFQMNLFKNIFKNNFSVEDQRFVLNNLKKISREELFSNINLEFFKKIFFSKLNHKFLFLNDLGLLEKMIPEFSKIDTLPQFDRFHSLSVGQHTLKALNTLKNLQENQDESYKFANQVLKKVKNKNSLFYAVLLHDIGKGLGGEHNLKGAKKAKKIVLNLNENTDTVKETTWLIENHMLLSEFAFKKDIEDDSVIKKICENINTIDRLNNLYLLTVSDISAVDHGIWNDWKARLLKALYTKIQSEVLKPEENKSLNSKITKIKETVLLSSKKINKTQIESFSKITYPNYWLLQSHDSIKFQIENFFLGKKEKLRFDYVIKKISRQNFLEITVVTNDRSSLFLDFISVFLSENLSVHEARIFTLDDGTVIDRFVVSSNVDFKFIKNGSKAKIKSIDKKLIELKKNKPVKILQSKTAQKKRLLERTEVKFDNSSSATYTVLEVTTNDRPALLYDISRILLNKRLVISMAKISTNGDFVEDSFHLRNEFGMKIDNKKIMLELQKEIIRTLKEGLNNVS